MPQRRVAAYIAGLVVFAAPLAAQTTLPPITLGAGLRTSFVHTSPDGRDDTDAFVLDSARLYVSGPVTEKIKFMFNTEYDGGSNKIGVLDAVARFEMSPKFKSGWDGYRARDCDIIRQLNEEAGLTVLLVEQKLPFARRVASEFKILEKGRCIAEGAISDLSDDLVRAHLSV